MTRPTKVIAFLALAFASSAANAQFRIATNPGIYGGFGPYAGFGPYSDFSPYYGGAYYGYGGPAGFGYNPLIYSQQLFQQQALISQQVFQQQQQAIIGPIETAQSRLKTLEDTKQQLVKQYVAMSDSDKAAIRGRLMREYLNLDARHREAWKRDGAMQTIIGSDLQRLESVSQIQGMSEADKAAYRRSVQKEYQSLSPSDQLTWQKDVVLGILLGKDWWSK